MNNIDVRATRSFSYAGRNFIRGRHYQVDMGDPGMVALMAGGYLRVTEEPGDGAVDPVGTDAVSRDGVVADVVGRKKTQARRKVSDGPDSLEPGSDHDDGAARDSAAGDPIHP